MNTQLLIVLIFFAISAISWLSNQLREKAEVKRIRDAMRKQQEESLRTVATTSDQSEGRPDPVAAAKTPQQARMEELAARRQAQLRALRERQAAESGQSTSQPTTVLVPPGQRPGAPGQRIPGRGTPTPPRQATNIPVPSAPGQRRTQPTTPTTRRGTPTPTPQSRQPGQQTPPPPRRREQPTQARQQAATGKAPARTPQSRAAASEERRMSEGARNRQAAQRAKQAAAPPPPIAATRTSEAVRSLLKPTGARREDRLRAVIAATEVLARPISVRPEHELPWNRSII